MPIIKFALFTVFIALLSVLNFSQSNAAAPNIVMQRDCQDGKVWSDEKQRCVPERTRGSY